VAYTFALAAGDLVGQAGWEAGLLSLNSPLVTSPFVSAGSFSDASAYQDDALNVFDLSQKTTVNIEWQTSADLTHRGYVDIVVGDVSGAAVSIQIDTNVLYATVNQVGILVDDLSGNSVHATNLPANWSLSHEISVEWVGTSIVVKLDGATVATGTMSALAALSDGDISVYFNEADGVATGELLSVSITGSAI
jgi:hypothetical protein